MQAEKIINIWETQFTLKQVFTWAASVLGACALYYQHNLINQQKEQMLILMKKLEILSEHYESLLSSVNVLKDLVKSRNLELINLKNKIEEITLQTKTKTSVIENSSDPMVIQAMTERYDLYLNIIKVAGVTCCAVACLWTAFWLVGKVPNPWTSAEQLVKGVAQKFGYLNDVERYTKVVGDTYWEVIITNKQDVGITVKYPGSGEYQDVYSIVLDYISKLSDKVHFSEVSTQTDLIIKGVKDTSTQTDLIIKGVKNISTQTDLIIKGVKNISTQTEIPTKVAETATQAITDTVLNPSTVEAAAQVNTIIQNIPY